MITKMELASYLCTKGYDCTLDSGVVQIRGISEKDVARLKKDIKATGYDASYGYTIGKGEKDE